MCTYHVIYEMYLLPLEQVYNSNNEISIVILNLSLSILSTINYVQCNSPLWTQDMSLVWVSFVSASNQIHSLIMKNFHHERRSLKIYLKHEIPLHSSLEWSKSGTLTTSNASEDVEQKEVSFIVTGNAKWYSHFGRRFGSFYKIKHILTIKSSNCTPLYFPRGVENVCPHKNLHLDVDKSFIHNFPNLETSKMSFSRWMGK